MQQFLEVFGELKGKKLWLTGESVRVPSFSWWDEQLKDRVLVSMLAFMFLVSFVNRSDPGQDSLSVDIANYIYENPTLLELSLQGIWVSDRACSSVVEYSYSNVLNDTTQHYFRGLSCKKRSLQ